MAEFEELRIGVKLSDDASEKLRKFKTEGDKFNADVTSKHGEKFKEGANLAGSFSTQLRNVAGKFTEFAKLPIFSGLGAASIVISLKIVNDSLGSFARDILRVRDIARTAGLSPDQFKSYAGQLKMAGYTGEQAEQEIISFFRTVDEAGRAGTPEFQRIWNESFNPELTMRRINQMRELIRSGEGGKAIVQAVQEAKTIMARELGAGRGMQEGRRQVEAWLRSVGLSMRALNINDISDFLGDPTKWARRIEAAERFNLEYTKFERVMGEASSDIKLALLPVFKDLNIALKELADDNFLHALNAELKADIQTVQKILYLLTGNTEKFAATMEVGPLRNYLTGNFRPVLADQPEGPPTKEGQMPFGWRPSTEQQLEALPKTSTDGYSTEMSPEQMERLKQRMRGGRLQEEQSKNKDTLKEDVKQNELLNKEVKRLNDNLFAEDIQRILDKFSPQKSDKFHNAPMGGAAGESDPIQLPQYEAQPGGGAAAEARKTYPRFNPMTGDPIVQGSPQNIERMYNVGIQSGSAVTQLGVATLGNKVYTTQELKDNPELLKKFGGGATLQDFAKGSLRGISMSSMVSGSSSGMVFNPDLPTAPLTMAHEAGHVGRAAAIAAGARDPNIFTRYGFARDAKQGETSEETQQRVLDYDVNAALLRSGAISDDVAAERIGQTERWLRSAKVTPEQMAEAHRHGAMVEKQAQKMLGSSFVSSPREELPLAPAFKMEMDRSALDYALGAESSVQASGSLDVNVTGAPADVKVTGDGMFKGNTTLTQQVELQP